MNDSRNSNATINALMWIQWEPRDIIASSDILPQPKRTQLHYKLISSDQKVSKNKGVQLYGRNNYNMNDNRSSKL